MAKDKKDSNIVMADRRKQIEKLYDGNDDALLRAYEKARGAGYGSRFNEEALKRITNQVGSEDIDRKEVRDLANFAYATDPLYAGIIDYLSNMFLWRYYYFPIKIKEKADETNYPEIYDLMTQIVDGLVIEVTVPTIITKLFKEGSVYLYAVKDTKSKTISTLMLNSAYCKPLLMSQYGTGVYQFDLKYFDDLGLRGEQLKEVLELFPEELTTAYTKWKSKSGPQLIVVDGRYSTYLNTNDYGFPTQISILKGLFDYDQYRANEIERNTARLDKILTHKIPSYEGRLLFELPEVTSLHKSMSKAFSNNKRTRLLTTFGDVEIHSIQEDSKFSTEVLEKAQEAVYRAAGLNPNQFNGAIKESLELGLKKDQSIVWRYIQQLTNFYNLTINNLYNFKGYQIQLTMLPITHYNLQEMMEIHRRNGEYGIGRLEAIVASGTKQGHIAYKSKLEEFLKLDEILKPLKSSHTQSSTEKETEKTEEKEITEDNSITPVKEVENDREVEDSEEDGEKN